jgi:hypothetical protein
VKTWVIIKTITKKKIKPTHKGATSHSLSLILLNMTMTTFILPIHYLIHIQI